MRLFVFRDDLEKVLVAAIDPHDAFQVVEETWGAEAADALVLFKLEEKGHTAARRGLLAHFIY